MWTGEFSIDGEIDPIGVRITAPRCLTTSGLSTDETGCQIQSRLYGLM